MPKSKLKSLKAKRWKLTSEYIRLKNSDHRGYCECVTCGTVKPYKEMDAGHFVAKGKGNSVYFVEENIHPQCTYCNRFQHGNLIAYTRYMQDMYGPEKVDELLELSHKTLKFTEADHLEAIEELKQKLKELKKTSLDKMIDLARDNGC